MTHTPSEAVQLCIAAAVLVAGCAFCRDAMETAGLIIAAWQPIHSLAAFNHHTVILTYM